MRVFVAVEVNEKKVIDSITQFQSKLDIKAKPVEPNNLHFTLQFLGEISEDMAEKIKVALRTINFSEFNVEFRGIGAFPKMKFPRVIWIGTDTDGGNSLVSLAQKVQVLLEPLGFTLDKPFKSHITIFRIKNKVGDISKELEKFSSYEFGSQKISSIKLKKSILTPEGPIYSDLEEVKAKL